jgi:hypothetical protein
MRPLGFLVPLSLAALGGLPLQQAWSSPAGGRIEKIVAGGDRLYALGGGSVEVFDGEGRALGSCARFEPPPAHAERGTVAAPDAEEALAAAGLADDDDSTDAEDALEAEGLGPRPRRRPSPTAVVEVRDLAASASAHEVWIATSSGLYRGADGRCAPAALAGRDLLLVAQAGAAVAAASDDLLWLLDDATSPGLVLAGLASRPRTLAIGDGPRIFIGDDEGILAVDAGGGATRLLDQPVGALAVCEGVALALASDGTYAWSADRAPERVGARPPARRLACGPGGSDRFVATGVGVWTSPDGAGWTERDETLGRSVASAAATDRIWVAIDADLLALDEIGPPGAAPSASATADAPVTPRPTLAAPAFPWPRLTIAFAAHDTLAYSARQSASRDGWSILVMVAIPLGRSARRGPDARGAAALAAETVERDATLAAEARRRATLPAAAQTQAPRRAVDAERRALP